MFTIVKMASLSAVLSAGLVTAYNNPVPATASPAEKAFVERLPQMAEAAISAALDQDTVLQTGSLKGNRHAVRDRACAGETWPAIPASCLTSADGTPVRQPVRTITLEHRAGQNTSVLVRVPAEFATQ